MEIYSFEIEAWAGSERRQLDDLSEILLGAEESVNIRKQEELSKYVDFASELLKHTQFPAFGSSQHISTRGI